MSSPESQRDPEEVSMSEAPAAADAPLEVSDPGPPTEDEPCEGPCRAALALAALPECSSPADDAFDAELEDAASSGYSPPEAAMTEAILASLSALRAGDPTAARKAARKAGYTVCKEPTDHDVALWHPRTLEEGYARFAWRVRGARPVIVEAPHPHHDLETDEQARLLFERLAARALLMAGAHRCSATETVGACTGTTGVCGEDDAPYPVSDVAHFDDSIFHAAHVFFSETFGDDWVLSLHGFSESGISVSDGTPVDLPEDAAAARVGAALQAAFPEEPVTSCNPYPGAVVEDRRCGTTNVQGRHLNGAPDACAEPATQSSGRFVHLEQSLEVRQQYGDRVAEAIDAALGAGDQASVPSEPSDPE